MRPALQRLLSRPSSLELLRYLVGTPEPLLAHAPAAKGQQCQHRTKITTRQYASVAVAVQDEDAYDSRRAHAGVNETRTQEDSPKIKIYRTSRALHTAPTETLLGKPYLSSGYYGLWKKSTLWTQDEIDFESNIAAPEHPARQRLIDQPKHKNDLQLFARLLDHRERRYGIEGIRMFWEAVKKRRILLPTRDYRESKNVGLPAEKLWTSFLTLGFYDNKVLEEVCAYADKLLEKTGRRWPRLYSTIVQHFLVSGKGKEALTWHNRLFERHPPTSTSFVELCHQTVHNRGDLKAFKEIYEKNEHRNAYGKIIPTLCWQEDFKSAIDWHFRLISKGDVPIKPQHAQALSRFLAIYDRRNAVRVTKSLVAAGAAFDVPTTLKDNVKISREIMNLVHGRTFKIPVKAYNDEYGARWFATSWVPLDLAIHSIHALGIQEIGPLSLQALCLRNEPDGSEPRPYVILRRIEQLRSIGISIGNSVFSRAVKIFAQNRMFNYLMGLLKSDQHPHALEDWKYLEHQMASFARIRDWDQYRRILAIRTIGSRSPSTEAQNVWLRTHVTNRDLPAVLDTLAKMQLNGTIVKTTTVAYILRTILVTRQQGRKVQTVPGKPRDLQMVATMLKGIMDAGNLVPAAYWREIVRRFGMMGRQSELHELCLFLASRYGPSDKSYLEHIGVRRASLYRVPAQVDPSHPLHPLKILFPVSLQKAIVEWGFIYALKRAEHAPTRNIRSKRLGLENDPNLQVTAGINLLKQLRQLGVHIDGKAIKRAIFNRLVMYYSPGRSNRPYNRVARLYAPDLELITRLIDDAMGRQTFRGDLKLQIVSRGMLRLLGRDRKAKKWETRRLKSRVFSNSRLLV